MLPRPVVAVGIGFVTSTMLVMVFWGVFATYYVVAGDKSEPSDGSVAVAPLSDAQLALVVLADVGAALAGASLTAVIAREQGWRCLVVLAVMYFIGSLTSSLNDPTFLPGWVVAGRIVGCPLVILAMGLFLRRRETGTAGGDSNE